MKIIHLTEDDMPLFEMANLSSTITGVRPTIFCSPSYGVKHSCHVKVSNTIGKVVPSDLFVIRLKDLEIVGGTCKLSSDDLESVKWWIHRNRFQILDYWKEKTDTLQFLQSLKPITK